MTEDPTPLSITLPACSTALRNLAASAPCSHRRVVWASLHAGALLHAAMTHKHETVDTRFRSRTYPGPIDSQCARPAARGRAACCPLHVLGEHEFTAHRLDVQAVWSALPEVRETICSTDHLEAQRSLLLFPLPLLMASCARGITAGGRQWQMSTCGRLLRLVAARTVREPMRRSPCSCRCGCPAPLVVKGGEPRPPSPCGTFRTAPVRTCLALIGAGLLP